MMGTLFQATRLRKLGGKRFITQAGGVKHHPNTNKKERTSTEKSLPEISTEYININVSGMVFKTRLTTLNRFSDTLLGNLADRTKFYDEKNGELFFDRHSPAFPAILYYYQSNGHVYKPPTVNLSLFKEELAFFKIKSSEFADDQPKSRWSQVAAAAAAAAASDGPNSVDPINSNPAYQYHMNNKPLSRSGSSNIRNSQRRDTVSVIDSQTKEVRSDGHRNSNASIVNSNHKQSITSQHGSAPLPITKEFNASAADIRRTSSLNSLHQTSSPLRLRHNRLKSRIYDILERPETGLGAKIFSWVSMSLILLSVGTFIAETLPAYKEDLKKHWKATQTGIFFFSFETACITFFTLELIGRFATCPNKTAFIKNKLNIIDLISIMPFYLETIIPKNMDSIGSLVILRVLRLFRVLRIFKLSRHSRNMIAFGIALKASLAELLSLGLFLLIDVVVFASALYYAEMDVEKTSFDSIPASCWWAVVTVTTLGYGDMCPNTAIGKIMGTLCVFSGILVIAFQMPIMVAKFTWTFMRNTADSPEDDEGEMIEEEYDEDLLEEEEFEEELPKPNGKITREPV